jgi:phage-related protein
MKVTFYQTSSGRVPVREFIDSLSIQDQAKFWAVYKFIQENGLDCPNVQFRQLKGKLWEIKFSSVGVGYRIAYVLIERDLMVWLHAFKKKTQQTPKNDLDMAVKRMKEVLKS